MWEKLDTVPLYDFNPSEWSALRFVHPLKRESVRKILMEPMSDFVEKIILFGSSLNLTCEWHSDLDLYAIVDKNDDSRLTYRRALVNICDKTNEPYDLLVRTQEDFEQGLDERYSVENQILEGGLILYEKKNDDVGQS